MVHAHPIKTNQGQDTRKASTTKKELVDTHGTILWDSENNITKWDKPALSALGFLSGLDINIYEHMDLLDRVHNDDCQSVRNFLKTAGDEKTTVRARFSNKAREYVECDLSIISNDEGKSIELSFHVIDS